jgi:peroxiredoxin Q/BCP
VFGVSYDDVASQAAFAEEHELTFALLSDPDGSVAAKYGVQMAGRAFARRVTFVLDDQGILRHVEEKVNVTKHGDELAELIKKLRQ